MRSIPSPFGDPSGGKIRAFGWQIKKQIPPISRYSRGCPVHAPLLSFTCKSIFVGGPHGRKIRRENIWQSYLFGRVALEAEGCRAKSRSIDRYRAIHESEMQLINLS